MQACEITEIRSSASPVDTKGWEAMSDVLAATKDLLGEAYWLLVYKHDEVLLNHSSSPEVAVLADVPLTRVKEVRCFCKSGELKLWPYDKQWRCRLRLDGQGDEKSKAFRESLVLWGKTVEAERKLVEPGRGTVIELPFHIEQNDLPIKVATVSYFGFDGDGLINFTDARLADITRKCGGSINA